MQTISTNLLNLLRSNSTDLVAVVEFYASSAVPGVNGLDPDQSDFLKGYSNVSDISFRGRDYEKRVTRFNNLTRTITKSISNATVTLSNIERDIAAFYFAQSGFEGLIMVIRLLSRSVSVNLDDSIVCFVGRCEKVQNFERSQETCTITAKHLVGSIEAEIPRRKFGYNDPNGRSADDKLFEGFRYMPIYGTTQYAVRERRGGIFGLLGFKKTVTKTLSYSSHSDLDVQKVVPVIFGRFQLIGTHAGYVDTGTIIETTTVFCEGPISDFVNARSANAAFPMRPDLAYQELHGYLGGDITTDPSFPQIPATPANRVANGYYSRSAVIFTAFSGSQLQSDDPAPELVAVVLGMQVYQPDGGGDFTIREWSDNPVFNTRFLLESDDYLKIGADWCDDPINAVEGAFCDEILTDQAGTDFAYLPESELFRAGDDYKTYQSTGVISPEYFKKLGGTLTGDQLAPFKKELEYNFFDEFSSIPIEPPDPDPPGPGTGTEGTRFRRRYTCNIAITEQQKAIDFLYDVILPSFRGYLTQNANGKIAVKIKKPVPFSFLRESSTVGANSIKINDVDFWYGKTGLKILIGAYKDTSELREITSATYTTDGNSITLTASGGVTASGANLSGGNTTTPSSAGITVTTNTGTKTVTINGVAVQYYCGTSDTVETIAGFLFAAINSNSILQKFVRAVWTPNTAVVTIYSKLGVLNFSDALEFTHNAAIADPTTAATLSAVSGDLEAGVYYLSYSWQTATGESYRSPLATITLSANQAISVAAITPPTGAVINYYVSVKKDSLRRRRIAQTTGAGFTINLLPTLDKELEPDYNSTADEILSITMAFSDRELRQSGGAKSNILKGTLQFPIGSRQKPINRVDLKYRDSAQDSRLTELQISDKAHQDKVKKVLNLVINGSAIDNYHQAYRITTGLLAENRDADFFYKFGGAGEALILEEGDVVCVTDSQGGIINLPLRIEDASLDIGEFPKVSILGRKYYTGLYDDRVAERDIPIATTLNRFTDNRTYFDRYGSLRSESGIVPVLLEKNENIVAFEINGTNTAGEIIFTTNKGYADTFICRIQTPAVETGFAPIVVLTPSNQNSANQDYFVTKDNQTFELHSLAEKTEDTEYRCFYHIILVKSETLNSYRPEGNSKDNIITGNDELTIAVGDIVLIDVLANDIDYNSGTLSIISVEQPTHGTAKIESGQIRYYANPYFIGKVSFYYTAQSSVGGYTSKGLVVIDITE